ncbi:hypothetical protein FOZ62_008554, partial [Perkinsus olseni]
YKYRNSDGKVSLAYTNSSRIDVADRPLMQELIDTVAIVMDLDQRNGEFEFDNDDGPTLEKEAMLRETSKMIEWLRARFKSRRTTPEIPAANAPNADLTSVKLVPGIYRDVKSILTKIGDIAASGARGTCTANEEERPSEELAVAESFLEHLEEYNAASLEREPKGSYRKVARRTVTFRPRKILREELPVVVNEQHRAAVEGFMRKAGVTASELRKSPPSKTLKSVVREELSVYWHKDKGWYA